jgi:hypothetical protein
LNTTLNFVQLPVASLSPHYFGSIKLAADLLVGIGRQRRNLILTKKNFRIFVYRIRGWKSMAVLIGSLGRYWPGTIGCAALFLM